MLNKKFSTIDNLSVNNINVGKKFEKGQAPLEAEDINVRRNMVVDGNVGIGEETPSVALDINASDAIRIPCGTSAERPPPTEDGIVEDGYIRYNTELLMFEGSSDGIWLQLIGGGEGISPQIPTINPSTDIVWYIEAPIKLNTVPYSSKIYYTFSDPEIDNTAWYTPAIETDPPESIAGTELYNKEANIPKIDGSQGDGITKITAIARYRDTFGFPSTTHEFQYKTIPSVDTYIPIEVTDYYGSRIVLSCSVDNSIICYTVNGDEPDILSTQYIVPFKLYKEDNQTNVTIKAKAFIIQDPVSGTILDNPALSNSSNTNSSVTTLSRTYNFKTLDIPIATPDDTYDADPDPDEWYVDISVSLSKGNNNPDVTKIYYTTDGTDPKLKLDGTPDGTTTEYVGNPIIIGSSQVIKAVSSIPEGSGDHVSYILSDMMIEYYTYTKPPSVVSSLTSSYYYGTNIILQLSDTSVDNTNIYYNIGDATNVQDDPTYDLSYQYISSISKNSPAISGLLTHDNIITVKTRSVIGQDSVNGNIITDKAEYLPTNIQYSDLSEFSYTYRDIQAPVISPIHDNSIKWYIPLKIILESSNPERETNIYYTISSNDPVDPTNNNSLYIDANKVPINSTQTIKAIAYIKENNNLITSVKSLVSSSTFTYATIPNILFTTISESIYYYGHKLTFNISNLLIPSNPLATFVFYTLDGTNPTLSSNYMQSSILNPSEIILDLFNSLTSTPVNNQVIQFKARVVIGQDLSGALITSKSLLTPENTILGSMSTGSSQSISNDYTFKDVSIPDPDKFTNRTYIDEVSIELTYNDNSDGWSSTLTKIYYTTSNSGSASTPTSESNEYTGPIILTFGMESNDYKVNLKAISVIRLNNGESVSSEILNINYIIEPPPQFTTQPILHQVGTTSNVVMPQSEEETEIFIQACQEDLAIICGCPAARCEITNVTQNTTITAL